MTTYAHAVCAAAEINDKDLPPSQTNRTYDLKEQREARKQVMTDALQQQFDSSGTSSFSLTKAQERKKLPLGYSRSYVGLFLWQQDEAFEVN